MLHAANGIARVLKMEGVPWVSTYPVCNVNNALGQENVKLYMMRDERYAVAVADAFSRFTNGKQIGVCTVMGGVNAAGLQMAYGALAQAYEDCSPVLCISDGVPTGAGGNSHYDIIQGFRSITKWIGQIDQPQRVPEIMQRAFTQLRTGRRGPVLVTIPRGLGDYDENAHPYTPAKGWKWAPDPADIKAAVKVLLGAKNPLLYIGEGVFYADATDELLHFAEAAQLPVMTTLKGKSAFPETHPLSVGVRGELAGHFLRKCDTLFAVGSSLSPGRFSHAIPDAGKKTIVQCVIDERDINKSYTTDVALIGDAKLALKALTEELEASTGGGIKTNQALLDEIKTIKAGFIDKYLPALTSEEIPINPYRVYGDLMKTIDPGNSFVTHDSGNTRDQISTVYEAEIPHGFSGWGNVSSLGFGLGAAMGAKLAYPERQCINITGDAGVSYMMGNFESLVRYDIGVTTIHINNGGFAGYGPGFWGEGHDPYTCKVLDHNVVDMSETVKQMGYYAEDIRKPSEIIPAIRRALEENGKGRPAYLEFICGQYPVFGDWVTTEKSMH